MRIPWKCLELASDLIHSEERRLVTEDVAKGRCWVWSLVETLFWAIGLVVHFISFGKAGGRNRSLPVSFSK